MPPRKQYTSPEEMEQALTLQAYKLAEKQFASGTASSAVIVHFLKLGTQRAKLEEEKLAKENLLLQAKADVLNANRNVEELYANAIKAMKTYQGRDDEDV